MKLRPAQLLGVFLILLGLACIGAGVYLFSRPADYRATVRIKVIHSNSVASPALPKVAELDANETDVEILQSEVVLRRVVEPFDLTTKWKLDSANVVQELKRRLKVESSPGTSFVNVSVLDQSPEDAAQIANLIAESYVKYRREAAVDLAQNSVRALSELRADVLQKIEAAELEANTMKTNLHIHLLPPEDQMKFPVYRAMRDSMAELTNSLAGVQKKLNVASSFAEHPPEGAEIVDRADTPLRPVEKNVAFPSTFAGAGLAFAIAGFLLGKRRSVY